MRLRPLRLVLSKSVYVKRVAYGFDHMAIFVVAVGAVLAALGCWAMYFGYSIVQVERGWAALIAGAVVFGGGVVTAALGLVLHRLSSIRTVLLRQPLAGLAASAAPAYPDPAPAMPAPPPQLDFGFRAPSSDEEKTVDPPAYRAEPHDPQPPHVASPYVEAEPMAAPLLGDVVHEMPHLGPSADEAAPTETVHEPAPSGEAPRRDDIDNMWRVLDDELTQTDWTKVLDAEAKAQPESTHGATTPEPHDPVAAGADTHAYLESEPAPGAADPAAAPAHPASGGSQSFENFVGDPRLLQAEGTSEHATATSPAAADESFVNSAYEDDYGDLLGRPPPVAAEAPVEDKSPPAAEDAPAPAGPAAHVMGRYEADGTTYTMYSDGSIEAQSPAGTYRFQSMAELKSFIEQAS